MPRFQNERGKNGSAGPLLTGPQAATTDEARVREILAQVKPLACEFYRLTGKPLGVTGGDCGIRRRRQCPTSRDFVPWRFLDAGQLSLPSVSSLPASKNQNNNRHSVKLFCPLELRYQSTQKPVVLFLGYRLLWSAGFAAQAFGSSREVAPIFSGEGDELSAPPLLGAGNA
jgi:hypothetical protein